MSVTIDYATLSKYHLLLLTSYQSFSMCLYDADAIYSGKSIGYGLDGYDLCRYIFPDSFFVNKPNPHHNQIKSTWESFFQMSDGKTTFGIISPFALLEILATIQERTNSKLLLRANRFNGIRDLINDIAQGIRELQEVAPEYQKTITTLYHLMKSTEGARKAVLEGNSFEKLKQLLTSNKLIPLDRYITYSNSTGQLRNLLWYDDQEKVNKALQYLNYKREKKIYSGYDVFYNTLDVFHYVLFENVGANLNSNNINMYISSSGLLSRNSWFLTKYGKLPDEVSSIPSNWSARSSDTPAYLTKAINHFSNDLQQTRDFFEESRAIARVILRDFLEIPEIRTSIGSFSERKRLHLENPAIKVSNKIPQAISRLQNEYFKHLFPEYSDNSIQTTSNSVEIDFGALYQWMTNPDTRSKEYHQVAQEVNGQTNALKLNPIDWTMYIAPLGDTAYDILKFYNQNTDI